MKVLLVTDGYLPGFKYGGPVRTLAAIVDQLGKEIDFHIVTAASDLGAPRPYPDVETDTWTSVGNASVWYSLNRRLLPTFWRRILGDVRPDLVYLNSFFSPVSIAFRLWHKLGILGPVPVLLAPRGEFSQGALVQKHMKKWAFIRIARMLGLDRSIVFQASTSLERDEIQRALGDKVRVLIAPDLTSSMPPQPNERVKQHGTGNFSWISRISPKKNLAGAISLLMHCQQPVSLTVYGPIEDESYWRTCQNMASSLPPNVTFDYRGPLPHEEVGNAISQHEFFLFPTLGENFGHVIAEALSQGLPVLLSDQTPWRGLQEAGVGWDIPLADLDRWRDVLDHCVAMDDDEYQAMSARCREYVAIWMEEHGGRQANLDMFRNAIKGTEK